MLSEILGSLPSPPDLTLSLLPEGCVQSLEFRLGVTCGYALQGVGVRVGKNAGGAMTWEQVHELHEFLTECLKHEPPKGKLDNWTQFVREVIAGP